MYHFIRNKNELGLKFNFLDIKIFEEQINYFRSNFNLINIDDLLNFKEISSKKDAVLLTFDDGYIEHYDIVLPILKKNNIQGCFYIPTSIIENNLLSVNKIQLIVLNTETELALSELFEIMKRYKSDFNLKSREEYFSLYGIKNRWDNIKVSFIKKMLQYVLPLPIRDLIIDELFVKFVKDKTNNLSLYMSVKQIQDLYNEGMYIGGHTHNHYHLKNCSYPIQYKEIKKSIELLANIGIQHVNKSFAYPFGSYNKDTISILSELNIHSSFCVKHGSIDKTNLAKCFELPRIDCNNIKKFM